MLAHHSYRESFNLQIADALVFYALPWKPEDVDQWIGRVDRLGREFVDPDRPSSRPKPVRILTIHRRDDPSIGAQTVLDEYRIFETAIDPERGILTEISESIDEKTLPTDRTGKISSEIESNEFANHARAELSKETTVPSGSPWTVQNAVNLHHEVARRSGIGPVLLQNRPVGYVTSFSEQALARWIGMLRNHKWINVVTFKGKKQVDGTKSRTFYTLGQNKSVNVKLDSVQDKSHPFPPFFIARGNIQRPPRLKVETSPAPDGTPRIETLQFLSFGSTIHQDLISTFRQAGKNSTPFGMTVYALGDRHYPKGTDLTCGTYLVGAGFIDSAIRYEETNLQQRLFEDVPDSSRTRREFMRGRVNANLQAGLESDERFVRLQRPPFLACLAWRLEAGNRMEPCTDEVAADLFGADWHKKERPNIESKQLPDQYIEQLPSFCRSQILQRTKSQWAWKDANGNLRRAVEKPDDTELLTRHEIQSNAPDLLVTNYSMLEYMMLRPIERSIFQQTRDYFVANRNERFILVLDEAHLYRGAQGTEVAMLIRRLRHRLELLPEQFQVIITSASFEDGKQARRFAAGLTGTDSEHFQWLQGEKEAKLPSGCGDIELADALDAVPLPDLLSDDSRKRFEAILPLLSLSSRPVVTVESLISISI